MVTSSSPDGRLSRLIERVRLRSIRARLTLAAAITTACALAVLWLLLSLMFEDHVERLVEDDLKGRLLELAGAIAIDESGRAKLVAEPTDPNYQRPASGAYWLIEEDGREALRSPSLWDFEFAPSDRRHFSPRRVAVEVRGPNGSTVYLARRDVVLEARGATHPVRITAALDTAPIEGLRRSFERQATWALAALAGVLSLGAWIQSSFGLRPLVTARVRLSRVQKGVESRMTGRFPSEIAPLVNDLNALLERQEALVRRARERAGDLAHGLKTPLTIIGIEANNAERRGEAKIAASLREQVVAMNRHVERELRRARLAGPSGGGSAVVDAKVAIDRLIGIFSRMPGAENCRWRSDLPAGTRLRMDPDDFGEIAGNLLDNARKHARTSVTVSIADDGEVRSICFDDDGEGIPEEVRSTLIQRGERANVGGEGAGLGLAIVGEALAQYGLALRLGDAPAGGCRASFPAVLCESV